MNDKSYDIMYYISRVTTCTYRPKVLRSTMPHAILLVMPLFTVMDGKSKRDVAAVNRTRGSCMASTNFTTKPLRRTYKYSTVKIIYEASIQAHYPGND
jgi:hypothetical protein